MPDAPSTRFGISRPADEDYINGWPAEMRAVIDAFDAIMAAAITDTPRPAAGVFGRFHRAADGTLSFDTGTAWDEIARHPHAAKHGAGGSDPLTVTPAMLAADVALPNIGDLLPTARQALPGNGKFAWADGSFIDRTVYPGYLSAVGHTFNGGVDPGGNLVRLPDARGRTLVMVDGAAGRLTGPDWLGAVGGAENVTISVAQMPWHQHSGATTGMDRANPHQHGTASSDQGGGGLVENGGMVVSSAGQGGSQALARWAGGGYWIGIYATPTNIDHLHGIWPEGGGQAHPNMPPYLVVNYLVRIA